MIDDEDLGDTEELELLDTAELPTLPKSAKTQTSSPNSAEAPSDDEQELNNGFDPYNRG